MNTNDYQPAVLVIDDEPSILDIIRKTLEPEGYMVYLASGPTEGLRLYEQHLADIRLILSDYMMPEMKGDALLEHLQRINPNVRVLLLSGFYPRGTNAKFENSLVGYLPKPFSLRELIRRVDEALV